MKYLLGALIGAVAFLGLALTMEAKKPNFKNTRWVCERKEFVADAGTMTETYSLEFSGKECTYRMRWDLPAHPAMYVREDGTIETIPASFNESEKKGTWSYRRGKLTVTFEDGETAVFLYEHDMLIGDSDGFHKAFLRQ